jgi:hypothetical protein
VGKQHHVDPRGGYSTAAAAVAKTFGQLEKVLILEGKKPPAGTGPVGQTAARMAAEKANVTITSRTFQRDK